MANQDPIFLAIKWSLLIINVISAIYVCIIFLEYLFNSNRHGLSIVFVFNCVVGFLIGFMGAYSAYYERYDLLVIYGVVLLINLVIASFGGDYVYRANLGLYVVCIILAFLFAYILRRGGAVTSPA